MPTFRQKLARMIDPPDDRVVWERRGRQLAVREEKQSLAAQAITSVTPAQARWMTQNYQTYANEGYGGNPYVYASIRQIAMAVAGIPWKLYTDSTKKRPIDKHDLLNLINRPNPQQGRGRFLENFIGYLLIDGNVYIERAGGNPPVELYVLRPDRVRIIPGSAANLILGYQYTVGATTVNYPAELILHQKFFNPLDDWYGMGPMRAASKSVDQSNMSKAWNVALLQHGATPTGAIKVPGNLSTKQDRDLREWIEDSYAGYINAGRPIVLEGGSDWTQMSINPVDMAWLEGQKLSAREIAMVFNIAPELIGDPESKTYSNYGEARKALYEENVLPLLDWTRDDLNAWLCPLYPDEPFLDYDRDQIEALQEDRDAIYNRNDKSFVAGWLRLGDAQKAAGVDVDPDYGNYYKWQLPAAAPFDPGPWQKPTAQTVITPVGPGQLPGANMPQLTAPGQSGQNESTETGAGGAGGASGTSGNATRAAGGAAGAGAEGKPQGDASATKALTPWKLPVSNKARRITTTEIKEHEQTVERLRETWINRAKGIFRKQLDPLISLGKDPDALGAALARSREEWINLVGGLYLRVGSAFAAETIKSTASRSDVEDFSADNPTYLKSFQSIIDSYTATEVPARVDRILESIALAIPARAENLDSPPEPKQPQDLTPTKKRRRKKAADTEYDPTFDDLATLFDDAALVIAESEVVAASNLGPLAGASAFEDAYGVSLVKTWQALHDDHTRESHLDADGQTVNLGDTFDVDGEQLMFPLDESRGATAKNVRYCRCVVTFDVVEVSSLSAKQSAALFAQHIVRLAQPVDNGVEILPPSTKESIDRFIEDTDRFLSTRRGK